MIVKYPLLALHSLKIDDVQDRVYITRGSKYLLPTQVKYISEAPERDRQKAQTSSLRELIARPRKKPK